MSVIGYLQTDYYLFRSVYVFLITIRKLALKSLKCMVSPDYGHRMSIIGYLQTDYYLFRSVFLISIRKLALKSLQCIASPDMGTECLL